MNKLNIISIIVKKIKDIKGKEINQDDYDLKFPNLEIDSIDYVEIMIEIEEELKINLLSKEIEWSKISTVNILSDLINEELKDTRNN